MHSRVTDAVLGPCRIVLDIVFPIPIQMPKHNWAHSVLGGGELWEIREEVTWMCEET